MPPKRTGLTFLTVEIPSVARFPSEMLLFAGIFSLKTTDFPLFRSVENSSSSGCHLFLYTFDFSSPTATQVGRGSVLEFCQVRSVDDAQWDAECQIGNETKSTT